MQEKTNEKSLEQQYIQLFGDSLIPLSLYPQNLCPSDLSNVITVTVYNVHDAPIEGWSSDVKLG